MTLVYNVTADELKQFAERYEQLEAEKKEPTDAQKEMIAELKGRGYDPKAFKAVIRMRKKRPDQLAEEEAVVDMYRTALGI